MSSPVFRRHSKKPNNFHGNSQRFRVAVFGQKGVGKTAFNVRFVTKRFIGEYDPSLESIYQREFTVPPNHPVFYEIMDTPGQEENDEAMKEKISWADAFILIYAVNDAVSFKEIARLKFLVYHVLTNSHIKCDHPPPVVVVANKCDLVQERMVSTDEGLRFASHIGCNFYEVSVRESVDEISKIFEDLYMLYRYPEKSKLKHSHHLSTLPAMLKPKIHKHIDKIPRLQGSPVVGGFQKQAVSEIDDTTSKEQADTEIRTDQVCVKGVAAHNYPLGSGTIADDCETRGSSETPNNFATKAAEEFSKKVLTLTLKTENL
ncbi:unnamed protein product [Clavelina lepadiformis]|uniref:small monomeric GTPase n=2 Tax=Clavelina lepadiformis TaxID=159417 RepID=A0ABP0FUB2_CLALP